MAAHRLLGKLLSGEGKDGQAIGAFREVIRLEPKDGTAHFVLGNALIRQGKLEDGANAFREVIRLDKTHAEGFCNLGRALRRLGRYAEALQQLEKGHELGSRREKWPYPSARWIEEARRLATGK